MPADRVDSPGESEEMGRETCKDHWPYSKPRAECAVCARAAQTRREWREEDEPYIDAASDHETDRVLLGANVEHTEDGAYVGAWIWVPRKATVLACRAARMANRAR